MMFEDQLELYQCCFEIVLPNGTKTFVVNAPRFVIVQQFHSYAGQIARLSAPAKVILKRDVELYDELDGKWVVRQQMISFSNNMFANQYGEAV